MISISGTPKRACDGFVRRDLLRAGSLGLFGGMTLPHLLRAEQAVAGRPRAMRREHHLREGWLQPGKAKSVILLSVESHDNSCIPTAGRIGSRTNS